MIFIKGTYVSDAVGNAYTKWQSGDNIGLNCGTGVGKSTFCNKVLGKYAKSLGKNILCKSCYQYEIL